MLFLTGMLQVSLVTAQTWLIAQGVVPAVLLVGFAISLVWTFNVKRVAFGGWGDRMIYAAGAGVGSMVGLVVAKLFT